MAVEAIAVGDVLDQPSGVLQDNGDGITEQIVRQGRYATLRTFAEGLKAKSVNDLGVSGASDLKYVASWTLERLEADYGRLTITVGETAEESGGGGGGGNLLETKWSLKNTQMTIPLARFYTDGWWSLSNPDGHQIAQWRQEPRKDLYDNFQFMAPDGNIYELDSASQAVATKYKKGIESVMRFHPVVIRTETYRKGMSESMVAALGIGSRLAHIDTPPKTFGLAPGTWLCIQDEADWAADGTLVRVSGWMGCKTLDADLYGDDGRWEPVN
ncbi:MAG: hypothetical protein IKO40_05300 [Kiritimatiellae bacterium]|nr:hypothetical protein [Kiritimatiellia bacterium]